ncbi:hypothetical protein L0Y34_01475 [Candidatus Parcubacteria bacterium]|nr:hypothetical protein [Candidatus Parcubacteria bacterium]
MFSELDERDAAMEIYLGRDAVFMYYARRALLWGRGEKSQKKVVYLNYSTLVKEERFTVEERRRYLRERGITDVSNAIFVDTGYVGSIPEHILKEVFDIHDREEIDKKILLISANDEKRMVRKSFRHDKTASIAPIEWGPMFTRSATGLYEDKKTGKLQPIAKPSDAGTILGHETIKYLCMRHFYLLGRWQKEEASQEARN